MKRLIGALAAIGTAGWLGACAGSPPASEARTVIVVRHAEKQPGSDDPALTEAGSAWADRLADFCAERGVRGVIATPFRRTMETALPTARAVDIEVRVVGLEGGLDGHAAGVARMIDGEPGVRAWLVVGHSNTVPAVIARLGGPAVELSETEYGRVFVITRGPGGRLDWREGTLEDENFTLSPPGGDGV